MSIEPKGNIEYSINGSDETIIYDDSDLKIIKNNELYSRPTFKYDSTEYVTTYELDTDEGKFIWEIIQSVSADENEPTIELIEQPDNIDIIEDISLQYIEDEDDY